MGIRAKFVLVVIPLMVVGLVISGVSSYFRASAGITRVAIEFFEFKVAELERHIESQWLLLVENGLSNRPDMVQALQAGIEIFARNILRSESEVIFIINEDAELVLSAQGNPQAEFRILPTEQPSLLERAQNDDRTFIETTINGEQKVTMGFYFAPFSWYVIQSERSAVFYQDINQITSQTIILASASSFIMIVLLLLFTGFITRPLVKVGEVMKTIIGTNNFQARVPVQFKDEIGSLSNTFNIMVGELDSAYTRIKKYALNAAIAQKKESKIRNIFQKYVPQELVDQFFTNPESMLIGQNREITILFSDIRSFTSISETMSPDELVNNLNRYFKYMVDVIVNRNGVIDKYIGDAIMAFFGAPVQHGDDPTQAVLTGIEMIEAVHEFNREQVQNGRPVFNIGIGINYGAVTVGNIGTDKKLDYTVIGDTVNVASRLEGLTKYFRQELLIAENLYKQVRKNVLCRIVGKVAVKGKREGLGIYTVAKKTVSPETKYLWNEHNKAMLQFYSRQFSGARQRFINLQANAAAKDYLIEKMIEDCNYYIKESPPAHWNGTEIMNTK